MNLHNKYINNINNIQNTQLTDCEWRTNNCFNFHFKKATKGKLVKRIRSNEVDSYPSRKS